ncbi:MAG: acyl-CoA dehydratase activase [Clostridiales Family XIII bacterium]|jgi:predicted CoA-substrate-specific enzyme activase|nr:acyl-CoA dehydratase activase [Clostridiales Family XIII bacterium]
MDPGTKKKQGQGESLKGQPQDRLRLGIDVGSTTVKLVILDTLANQVCYSRYLRHNARQAETALALLDEASDEFPDARLRIAVCGSGGRPVAQAIGAHYIQEVVSNAAAVRSLYPEARTAIELGGQDAKVVFFRFDDDADSLVASDMRMNGSCAGGTGAFIDEIAALLGVPTEEFEALAREGSKIYDISGRCGVFAKTDIQPLLIQGAAREDIALSTFHAIAKQTIGGLAQGLELTPPIVFEGGPLTFNPTLVRVFSERLGLKGSDVIRPESPETIVARGTALAVDDLFPAGPSGDDSLSPGQAAGMLRAALAEGLGKGTETAAKAKPFFASPADREAFEARHSKELLGAAGISGEAGTPKGPGSTGSLLRVWIGIDSGSTTSKIVMLDDDEDVVDTFYSNNCGDPLRIVRDGLLALRDKYSRRGIALDVLGLGATGYGELLFAKAFGADHHTVETVAHAQGCKKYIPDASFILDIGGQDMKAIWVRDGTVTDIMLNEACSSGCGSFLETFAATLEIPAHEIAEAAFLSEDPAVLGSRCTVFMNSTVIGEQRNGKQPRDIMAGLCRSIIENVFTKVVRISDASELGGKIVAQGGTFRNFAVLRAFEEYIGEEVVLAPYPGEMGALGAALLAKHSIGKNGYASGGRSSFIGFDAMKGFGFRKEDGVACPLCANHCSRTVTTFSTGAQLVTGNRCERGASTAPVGEGQPLPEGGAARDMFLLRNDLLFREYAFNPVSPKKDAVIGLPRVLEFWDSMPFWTTFFHALGFQTKLSNPSSRRLYEQGIQYVASDTVCFPAKLVHGHIKDLADQGADRIFMPLIMRMPPEDSQGLGRYVCPVIMGYPMVVRNFESPETNFRVRFDTPVFHWFTAAARKRQICEYAAASLGVTKKEARAAFAQGSAALGSFRAQLMDEGRKIRAKARAEGGFAVVLAGRPYHTDPLVCHSISRLFAERGISVLAVDALEGLGGVDLSNTLVDITNDFHSRMLQGASIAASAPELEYAQIVSFGCGHDAILSDEIVRIMAEAGGKSPLVLKVDESDTEGSLGIRIQSFIETVKIRREKGHSPQARRLSDPYSVKYRKEHKRLRTLLVPNISGPVSTLLGGILRNEGFRVKTVPVGSIEQIQIGKKYTHNDICFPCQMVIGEIISELQKGGYKPDEVAVGMAKLAGDCRVSHYAALLRRALDRSGFAEVPIVTTDLKNSKNIHPGIFMIGPATGIQSLWVFTMLDILEELRRKIRPYELNKGETNRVFDVSLNAIAKALGSGLSRAVKAFREAIGALGRIPYDRSVPKPRVLVTGELLVNYHPGSNFDIENYLEHNGMETIFPRATNLFRMNFLAMISRIKDFKASTPPYPFVLDKLFDFAQSSMEKIASAHPLFKRAPSLRAIYEGVRDIIPMTLSCGEGWLIAAEIDHYAAEGVNSFVILQPFGCLPNHVCGRGVTKRIKDRYPAARILPLDLDPDTSVANVENRLQMLIMNNRG